MPRPLVTGNGNLLVALDGDLFIRDLTYPFVGLLNHLSGHRVRLGVWVEGQFAWLSDPGWRKRLRYEPDTLVTRAECQHDDMAIGLIVSDCVEHRENILLRRFDITNRAAQPREARLFLSHDFHIAETDIGDTAFYNPFQDAVIHYKRDNYFLISGAAGEQGIYQYTTGIKGFGGAEGTWRDAEDGWLSMNPIEQGSVDSTVSFRIVVPPGETSTIRAWVCAGYSMAKITRLHTQVRQSGFDTLRQDTANYWRAWSHNETSEERLGALPAEVVELFRRSLLIIRTQVDNRGAILAANDSDIMETARAHYAYMWPRDGALVVSALDQLGYQDITRRFFTFCGDILPKDRPALMHKYSADGSWGATWHPWIVGDQKEVPFQQDSTALVLWALWRHYRQYRDLEFVEELYAELVIPATDFILLFRDAQTNLPSPSYDLWEERRGVHAYTCGALFGALQASASLARVFHDAQRADNYTQAAEQLREGVKTHLWDESAGRYARRLIVRPDGSFERDLTVDSALYGLFAFGMFPADDPRLEKTLRQTLTRLWVQTDVGGMARYENDYYFRRSDDIARIPGNPWIICTLWAAQFSIARAAEPHDLETALGLLLWAAKHAAESGVLSEQIHPLTGEPLSVSPLTWSHAEFVATTLLYLDRLAAFPQTA
jgi:GH15 family glucan-1,4-alpha-glucosidase